MVFSNLGSHNVLDPSSWQLDSFNCQFCTLKSLLFLRISGYLQRAFNFDTLFSLCFRSTGLLLFQPSVCHQPFLLGSHVLMLHRMLWKNLNELFGQPSTWEKDCMVFLAPLCSRTPCFLCLHLSNYFPLSFHCSKSFLS